jgi:hypothetical protein
MITNAVDRNDDMGGQGFVECAFEKGDHPSRMQDGGGTMKGERSAFRPILLAVVVSVVTLLAAASAHSSEIANERGWRIWLEPKSNRPPVTLPLSGSERTVVCAGFLEDDGPRAMTKDELAAMGIELVRFTARARQNAAADLATLKPRYVRNRQKVIEYAELTSDRPIVAGAVLAPTFLALWKDTLGEKVIVVVPNRFTAYVFPAIAGHHADYGPMAIEAFHATAWPISIEVFQISGDGIKCVGRYEEP